MKRILILIVTVLLLTGCSDQTAGMTRFEKEMDAFCESIAEIDEDINKIANKTEDLEGLEEAKEELLACLDQLDDAFKKFANMDFPEEFDYLEDMADESGDYMTEAVRSYHMLYGEEDGYSVNMEEYANENYARAYKRVKIIVTLLNGEIPTDEDLTIQ